CIGWLLAGQSPRLLGLGLEKVLDALTDRSGAAPVERPEHLHQVRAVESAHLGVELVAGETSSGCHAADDTSPHVGPPGGAGRARGSLAGAARDRGAAGQRPGRQTGPMSTSSFWSGTVRGGAPSAEQ